MELAAASPVRTAAAKLGRRVHSTLEGLKVLQLSSDTCSIQQLRSTCPHHQSERV